MKLFKGLQWKIVFLYSLLILFGLQLTGVYLVSALEEYYLQNFVEGLEVQSELLASFVAPRINDPDGVAYVADIIEGFLGTGGVDDIVVLNRYARVVGLSGPVERIGYKMIQEEIAGALTGSISEAIRINPDNGRRHFYMAFPVKNEGVVVGVIYLNASLAKIDQTISEIKKIIISGFGAVLLISIAIGMMLARTISLPIRDVTRQAEEMARGVFSRRIKTKSDDEIGQLINMYNYLASRLEDTLQEINLEKVKIEAILYNMRDGVLALDGSGRIIHINSAAQLLLKTDGFSWQNQAFNAAEILPELVGSENMAAYFQEKTAFSTEITRENPYRVFKISLVPFQTEDKISLAPFQTEDKISLAPFQPVPFQIEDKKIAGTIVVIQDITREKELRRQQEEFVANVSHELKTPLTSVISYVEALLDDALDDPDTAQKFLRVVNDEAGRMAALVKDLLELSRFDNKQEELDLAPVNLYETIKDMQAWMQVKQEARLDMQVLVSENLPLVRADRRKLGQVFANLLDNAVKFIPGDGTIKITAEEKGETVCVCVQDSGIGILPQNLERVFERFYRVDKNRSRQLGGSGLGLAITRQIIEAHGGRIWIESELNAGTAVFFDLPVWKEEC